MTAAKSTSASAQLKKREPTKKKPSKKPAVVPTPPREIAIPATFSPSHSYRAAAAYSLLRTLSNELRLSAFTLRAFTNALVLPVPSKLLGEIHVRVLRVLFANERELLKDTVYSKVGDGGTEKLAVRRKVAVDSE